MKLFKNFFITIKTKGFIATLLAIKNFFIILLVNVFSSSVFIKRKIFNYKMYLNPRDKGISRTLLLFGERELDHKIILEKVLKKNMKIFDIGANIGFYVLMESKLIGDNGKIVAVEPVPENLELLKKNLELNNNKINEFEINPTKYGFKLCNQEELKGGSPSKNAKKMLNLFQGEKGHYRNIVLLNAAAAFCISDSVKTYEDGIDLANQLIDNGKALKTLQNLIKITNE